MRGQLRRSGVACVVVSALLAAGVCATAGPALAQTEGGACSAGHRGDTATVGGIQLECRRQRVRGRTVYRWVAVSNLGGGTDRCLTHPAGTKFVQDDVGELQKLLDQKLGTSATAKVTGGLYQVEFVDGQIVASELINLAGTKVTGQGIGSARATYHVDGDWIILDQVLDDEYRITEELNGTPLVNLPFSGVIFGSGGRLGFACDGSSLVIAPVGANGLVPFPLHRTSV